MSLHRLCCCSDTPGPCCSAFPICTRDPGISDSTRRLIYQFEVNQSKKYEIIGVTEVTTNASVTGSANAPWASLPTGFTLNTCSITGTSNDYEGDDIVFNPSYNCPEGPIEFNGSGTATTRVNVNASWGGNAIIITLQPVTPTGFTAQITISGGAPPTISFFAQISGAPAFDSSEVTVTLVSADYCPLHVRIDFDATRIIPVAGGSCPRQETTTITGFLRLQLTGLIDCSEYSE